jgi:beta-lactam-binding protein with PASTA domain
LLPASDEGVMPVVRSRLGPEFVEETWEVVDVSFPVDTGSTELASRGPSIPDFRGRTLRQVTEDCLRLGLRCQSAGSGVAIAQSRAPGSAVRRGSVVEVRFSTSWNGGSRAPVRP